MPSEEPKLQGAHTARTGRDRCQDYKWQSLTSELGSPWPDPRRNRYLATPSLGKAEEGSAGPSKKQGLGGSGGGEHES